MSEGQSPATRQSAPAKRSSTVDRVLLPLVDVADERAVVMASNVLADWFGASLQVLTNDPDDVDRCTRAVVGVSSGISEPPVVIDGDDFFEGVAAHGHVTAPSLCVVETVDQGRQLALLSDQPIFVPSRAEHPGPRRMATGPLVVPLLGHPSDLDALAVAATWAAALDLGVRLVASTTSTGHEVADDQVDRLRRMGIDAGLDRVGHDLVGGTSDVALSRKSTAVIVAGDGMAGSELLDRAQSLGVPIVIAPGYDPVGETDTFHIDFTNSGPLHRSIPAPGLIAMTRADCLGHLEQSTLGRLGYVEHGWPVVVPVNYSARDGAVVIRSLPGGKLEAAKRREVVCLQIDGSDPADRHGWSVLAHGYLEVIADQAQLRSAWEHDPDPWVDSGDWQWLRMVPLSLTGRTIKVTP